MHFNVRHTLHTVRHSGAQPSWPDFVRSCAVISAFPELIATLLQPSVQEVPGGFQQHAGNVTVYSQRGAEQSRVRSQDTRHVGRPLTTRFHLTSHLSPSHDKMSAALMSLEALSTLESRSLYLMTLQTHSSQVTSAKVCQSIECRKWQHGT